jgi:hypothetical protein
MFMALPTTTLLTIVVGCHFHFDEWGISEQQQSSMHGHIFVLQ